MDGLGRGQLHLTGRTDGVATQLAYVSLVDGKNNSYVGIGAGANRPLYGGNNTYVGAYAGANAVSDSTTLLGAEAGRIAQRVKSSTFVGYRSGQFAERVESTVCIGTNSGRHMTRANNNTVVGSFAGAELTSGSRNTVIGSYGAYSQYNGSDNVCVGYRAGYTNKVGSNNCYVGTNSGLSAYAGYENVCLGVGSGQFLTRGSKNVLCGYLAGNVISNASNCIAIGTRTMEYFRQGDNNTCLGTQTARRFTGNNNTIIGGYAAANAAGNFNTVIGSRSMNRRNGWKVRFANSVIVGENVKFDIPLRNSFKAYSDALFKSELTPSPLATVVTLDDGTMNAGNTSQIVYLLDTSPTGDLVLPYEQFFSIGSPATGVDPAERSAVSCLVANASTYVFGWNQMLTDFPLYDYLDPKRYLLKVDSDGGDDANVTLVVDSFELANVTIPLQGYRWLETMVVRTSSPPRLHLQFRPWTTRGGATGSLTQVDFYGDIGTREFNVEAYLQLSGTKVHVDSTSIDVANGIATFFSPKTLGNVAPIAQSHRSYQETGDVMPWLNHVALVPGADIYVYGAVQEDLNGYWTVTTVDNVDGGTSYTVDYSSLNLRNGRYPIGINVFVYLSRPYFHTFWDGLQFFVSNTDPRKVLAHVPLGHDIRAVGDRLYLAEASDSRFVGLVGRVANLPSYDGFAYDPSLGYQPPRSNGLEGSDRWVIFTVDFDVWEQSPGYDAWTALDLGTDVVMYTSKFDRAFSYVEMYGDSKGNGHVSQVAVVQPSGVDGAATVLGYSERSDFKIQSLVILGPTSIDGHLQLGAGTQAEMDANIGANIIEFSALGPSRAVYQIGEDISRLEASGTFNIPDYDAQFGMDWLAEYDMTFTKKGNALWLNMTNTFDGSTIEIANVVSDTIKYYGSFAGSQLPIDISDILATPVPRITFAIKHSIASRYVVNRVSVDLILSLQGGSLDGNLVYTPTIQHASKLTLLAVEDHQTGSTIEYFANTFIQLACVAITAEALNDAPLISNVVYLGSSQTIVEEEDRQDTFIASLGTQRLLRGNVDIFTVYSNVTEIAGNLIGDNFVSNTSGTATEPAFSFAEAPDAGMWSQPPGNLCFVAPDVVSTFVGNALVAAVDTYGLTVDGNVTGAHYFGDSFAATGAVSGADFFGDSFTATGNVSGDVFVAGTVESSGTITGTTFFGDSFTATGNVSGDVFVAGTVESSGTITGTTFFGDSFTATGYVTAGNISMPNDTWNTSFDDSKYRVYYASNGSTSWAADGYEWYDSSGTGLLAALDAGGNLTTVGSITQYASDARLKANVAILENAVSRVRQLRGVSFDWRTDTPQPMRGHDVGLIAQDVLEALPQAVRPSGFDPGYLTIDTGNKLIALLVEAIKELADYVGYTTQ